MKLNKEQKDELARKLDTPWGQVELRCDGYDVTLSVQRYKGMQYRVLTYVNGSIKGEWFRGDKPAPESKFLRKSVRPNLSPSQRKEWEKKLRKRFVKNDPFASGSVTLFLPDWASGKAAISHLDKVCDSIEVIQRATASMTARVTELTADSDGF